MRERSNQNNSIIQIHPSFYIIALGFVLTGYYLNLIIFTSLIIFHEFGHFIAAKLCQAKVKKIVIYPYGGKTILEDYLNRDIHQEIFIASSGVIFQFIYYLFICFLHQKYFIRTYTMNLFTLYNSQMIFFNLLPIYPLDGGKILNMLLCITFPYKLANLLTITVSLTNIILLFTIHIYQYNYSNLMIGLILLYYLYLFYQKRKYLYQKFLLERYLYHLNYPKLKIIKNINQMYKNKSHLIYHHKKYQEEAIVLNQYFKNKNKRSIQ